MCSVSATTERKEKGDVREAGDKLKVRTDLLAKFSLGAHICTILQTLRFVDCMV